MAGIYVAKAKVVKVSVGSAEGNRVARIIRAGGVIPEGVDEAALKALAKRGLIERVEVKTQAETDADAAAAAKAKADADAKAKKDADDAAAAKAKADADAKAKAAAAAKANTNK